MQFGECLGGDIAIPNIYASTNVKIRCNLWKILLEELLKDCKWFLGGDWNFVEQSFDKLNPNGQIILVGERRLFSLLSDALNVEDVYPTNNKLKFLWDNK